eukprot:TRINITY_DN52013_c0_g1_i1.p2 TRINITY_DN52013_c0_g1~~TRINITY_DN52013_c0_g1_i1.p2  ORF type:complete len:201 (+),score=58.80 TRINITY_DN52013_c0_g1_i1:69-671(+)
MAALPAAGRRGEEPEVPDEATLVALALLSNTAGVAAERQLLTAQLGTLHSLLAAAAHRGGLAADLECSLGGPLRRLAQQRQRRVDAALRSWTDGPLGDMRREFDAISRRRERLAQRLEGVEDALRGVGTRYLALLPAATGAVQPSEEVRALLMRHQRELAVFADEVWPRWDAALRRLTLALAAAEAGGPDGAGGSGAAEA